MNVCNKGFNRSIFLVLTKLAETLYLRIKKDNMFIHVITIRMQKLTKKTVNSVFSNMTTDNDMTEK
jgi:hypothetical protein